MKIVNFKAHVHLKLSPILARPVLDDLASVPDHFFCRFDFLSSFFMKRSAWFLYETLR